VEAEKWQATNKDASRSCQRQDGTQRLGDCDVKDFVFWSGGDSRFIHLSPDRRELALSLALHEEDERYACDLGLQDSRMSL
jgi:hypothetical protein